MNSDIHESFLQLIRLGIGTCKGAKISNDINWAQLKALADAQGLSAIILDALNMDNSILTDGMSLEMKFEWIGDVVQDYEGRYLLYKKAIGSLASFYNQHGIKMMVLKGYACGLNWLKPEHRPYGDIDIWLFGQQEEADKILREKGIEIDNSHHHHSVFEWQGFTVENHYDFINTHAHRSSRLFEKRLKELANRDCGEKDICGATVYLPGVDFNFLFLLRHMANHFVGKEMTLRQLLDWALFIEYNHEEIDWKEGLAFLEAYGLLRYFNLMVLISVERLGFNRDIFHCELKEDELKERVFNDIIAPEYDTPFGKGALRIMAGKTHRWWSNKWKRRLCYPDSLLSSFIYGVWAKIQKPAHFLH